MGKCRPRPAKGSQDDPDSNHHTSAMHPPLPPAASLAAQVRGCTISLRKRVRPSASTRSCRLLYPTASSAPPPADAPQTMNSYHVQIRPLASTTKPGSSRKPAPPSQPAAPVRDPQGIPDPPVRSQNKSRKLAPPFASAPWSNTLSPPTCSTAVVPHLVPTTSVLNTATKRTPTAHVLLSDLVPSP